MRPIERLHLLLELHKARKMADGHPSHIAPPKGTAAQAKWSALGYRPTKGGKTWAHPQVGEGRKAAAPAPEPSEPPRRSGAKALRTEVVDHHVKRLKDLEDDHEAFDGAVRDLLADPKVRRAEVFEVAAQYAGGKRRFDSREHAVQAIQRRRTRREAMRAYGEEAVYAGPLAREAPPPDEAEVAAVAKRLEDALGDSDRFEAAMVGMDAKPTAYVHAVAAAFTGRKGSSKKESLQRIRTRHETLLAFLAKKELQRGRTAG